MMSGQPARARQEFKPFTPEERASFLAHRFGATLDWSSAILVALDYPVEELRWFVDAVQGICKGGERRIAHATLVTRAQRFRNPPQAQKLAKRAITADREWSQLKRRMVFDIESPKPGEMEGRDKRARTRYTDYLTPAAVWAQEAEHRAKKADETRWKRDSKHRFVTRQEIVEAAIRQLPSFEHVEDMSPGGPQKDDTDNAALPLSKYVEQRESILLAENRRILARLTEGDPVETAEIDERLAALEVYYARARRQMETGYESARADLLALRSSRCVRLMDFTDPLETVAGVDEILAAKGDMGGGLSAGDVNGTDSTKSPAGVPLSVRPLEAPEDDFEEIIIGTTAPAPLTAEQQSAATPSQLDCALSYAALGLPVFPTKPNKAPYLAGGFKVATTDPAIVRSWWRKWPDAGIGIPTGKASGWFVVDIDPRHGGDASLSALIEQYGELPDTSQTATPSGGAHIVFKYPTDITLGNSAGKLGKGIDTRGEGGYIVAPGADPSRRWVNGDAEADLPQHLIGLLLAEKHEPVNTDRSVVHYSFAGTRQFGEGERDNGIRDVAYGRWVNGWAETEADLVAQCLEVNATRCVPPLEESVVIEKARRTARKFARGACRQEVTL